MADHPIRIAYVIGTLDVGGGESQMAALASGLDRRRFAPSVFCLSGEGPLAEPLRADGVPVTNLGLRGLSVWRNPVEVRRRLWPLFAIFARERPAIVHGFLYHAYVIGAVAGRWARADAVVASRRSLSLFKAARPLLRTAERFTNRLTDIVIANSQAVREDAIRTEGLPPEKVVVIYNGLRAGLYALPAPPALARDLDVAGRRPIVVAIANFIHYKGHRFLLDAWSHVRRTRPEAVLLLAGDGPQRGALDAQARQLGLADSVRFLGVRHDVPAILALADLLVHPSLEEGFCNAVLEAMAAGRPVVATRVGGNPEAVVEGETGLLVPPADPASLAGAMATLMNDAGLRERMGAAGRQRAVALFGVDAMVRRYEEIYERLLSKRQPRRVGAHGIEPAE